MYPDRFPGADDRRLRLCPGQEAVAEAETAMAQGRVIGVIGEAGSGKTALVSLARHPAWPRERVLNARPPAPQDVDAWLALWTPELGKDDTCAPAWPARPRPLG
jgi:hypothetical protein